MAKYDSNDDIGKPGKPPKHRRFPWRLWLYAIAMTGAASYGVSWWWQHRADATTAAKEVATCRADLAKVQPQVDEANKKYAGCNTLLDANNKLFETNKKKAADQEVQLTAAGHEPQRLARRSSRRCARNAPRPRSGSPRSRTSRSSSRR